MSLITVCQSTHSGHNAEYIVVDRIYTDLGTVQGTDSVVGQGQYQGGIVNTGEVACAAGLVLLRLQGEGVHVDTNSGDVGVVLVGLDQVEVASLTVAEPVVTVELDDTGYNGVVASQTLNTGYGVSRLQDGTVPPVGVVEGLLSLPGANYVVVAADERVTLNYPYKLLARVVEVQANLVLGTGDGLTASVLQLLNQVLVRDLGEAATLVSVQVDVIYVQGGRDQSGLGDAVTDGVSAGGGHVPAQVVQVVELKVNLDLVVLEGNQGQSQSRVAVEPELKRDVQSVLRGTLQDLRAGVGLTTVAGVVAVLTALGQQVNQLGYIANHLSIASLLSSLLGQLIPNLEPVTVVLVNLLSANLQLYVGNQVVTDPVQPAELSTRAIAGLEGYGRQSGLQVDAVNQVSVTGDCACYLLAEVGRAVEGLLNSLHGKVSVASVDDLEEGNLRVAS